MFIWRYIGALVLFILILVAANEVIKVLTPLLPILIIATFLGLALGGYIKKKRHF